MLLSEFLKTCCAPSPALPQSAQQWQCVAPLPFLAKEIGTRLPAVDLTPESQRAPRGSLSLNSLTFSSEPSLAAKGTYLLVSLESRILGAPPCYKFKCFTHLPKSGDPIGNLTGVTSIDTSCPVTRSRLSSTACHRHCQFFYPFLLWSVLVSPSLLAPKHAPHRAFVIPR